MENSNYSGQYSGTPPYGTGPAGTTDAGKTAAIVAYITFIGWLVSYFALYKENKTSLAAYHLRQTCLLYLIGIGWYIISGALFFAMPGLYFMSMIVNIGLFVLWLIGLIAAINGQSKPMPLIGEPAQRMFRGL